MPRIRLLADNAIAAGSATAGQDYASNMRFDVKPGDAVPVVLDATGYVGIGDSIASSDWTASDSAGVSSRAVNGAVASCVVAVPEVSWRGDYWVRNKLTLTSGPVRNTVIWLRALGDAPQGVGL